MTASTAQPRATVPSLAERTSSGFAWMMAQTVGTKFVASVGQVILAWRLNPDEWGLVVLALTTAGFAGTIQRVGIKEILIHRQRSYQLWANPAAWMSLVVGLVGGLVIAGAAPIAPIIFRHSLANATMVGGTQASGTLVNLVLLLAAAAPFDAIALVPSAKLHIDMRFRAITVIGMITNLAIWGLSIFLAYRGFGAYSFVLPRIMTTVGQTIVFFLLAGWPFRVAPQFRRWRYMLRDAGYLFATAIFSVLSLQGDYLAVGLLHPKAVLGVYYFAYGLSTQTLQLVSVNLGAALFPALSKIQNEPLRQTQACIRICRVLMVIGLPLCVLQGALAAPVLEILFHGKWNAAELPFALLSVGMGFVVTSGPVSGLVQAQGRFRFWSIWCAVVGVAYFLTALVGALLGEATSVAAAVVVFYLIFGPLGTYFCIRATGGTWRDVAGIYLPATLLAALAVGIPTAVMLLLPVLHTHALIWGLVVGVGSVVLYLLLAPLVARRDYAELRQQARELTRRLGSVLRTPRGVNR